MPRPTHESRMPIKSETTDMLQWLPGEQEQRETYDQFVSRFGHDDVTLTLQSAKTVTKLARCPLQAERTCNRSVVAVGVW